MLAVLIKIPLVLIKMLAGLIKMPAVLIKIPPALIKVPAVLIKIPLVLIKMLAVLIKIPPVLIKIPLPCKPTCSIMPPYEAPGFQRHCGSVMPTFTACGKSVGLTSNLLLGRVSTGGPTVPDALRPCPGTKA